MQKGSVVKAVDKRQTLLLNIQVLYDRIGNMLLRKRLQSYHSQSGKDNNNKLHSTLSNYLDKLHASHMINQQSEDLHSTYITATIATRKNTESHQGTEEPTSRLARYFKEKSTPSSLHPYISEKLKASILENIHTSIRLARQGQRENADLHSAIVRQALDELRYFLTIEEYIIFTNEVDDAISCCRTLFDTRLQTDLKTNKH